MQQMQVLQVGVQARSVPVQDVSINKDCILLREAATILNHSALRSLQCHTLPCSSSSADWTCTYTWTASS